MGLGRLNRGKRGKTAQRKRFSAGFHCLQLASTASNWLEDMLARGHVSWLEESRKKKKKGKRKAGRESKKEEKRRNKKKTQKATVRKQKAKSERKKRNE